MKTNLQEIYEYLDNPPKELRTFDKAPEIYVCGVRRIGLTCITYLVHLV